MQRAIAPVTARSMCNHPGGRLPREIAGGKAQRLVPWQREDKLGAGGGERWSQPKAINSLSGVQHWEEETEEGRSQEGKEAAALRMSGARKLF